MRSALLALALVALIGAAGCGGGDDSSDDVAKPAKTATAPEAEALGKAERERRIAAAKKERAQKNGKKPKHESKAERAREAREIEKERAQDRKVDREFDKGFEETAFDKLIDKLPIRKPPLYVEQYITDGKTHKLFTAVNRKRFFCKLNPRQRGRAVEGFYREAEKVMRAGGVKDFVQVVTVTAETVEELPALATARNGSVALTRLGRGRGPC